MPEYSGFKYVYSLKHIEHVFKKVKEAGRPDKLTLTYLKDTWILKNAQYSAVLDLLRAMDFIDTSGRPTALYAEYQNPKYAKKSLAKGIKNAYSKLFKAYPNAQDLSNEELKGYFKQQTGAEQSVLTKLLSTFSKLRDMADFTKLEDVDTNNKISKDGTIPSGLPQSLIPITMNIQIIIPSDASPEQYDKIFSSIKKFLIK